MGSVEECKSQRNFLASIVQASDSNTDFSLSVLDTTLLNQPNMNFNQIVDNDVTEKYLKDINCEELTFGSGVDCSREFQALDKARDSFPSREDAFDSIIYLTSFEAVTTCEDDINGIGQEFDDAGIRFAVFAASDNFYECDDTITSDCCYSVQNADQLSSYELFLDGKLI